MDISKPAWLVIAEQYLGVKEVPGTGDNPVIVGWLTKLNAWWRDDLTPWCGTFVAYCLRESGVKAPAAWYRAKSYLDWGIPLAAPAFGCLVVFTRVGGGHVGFVVGKDAKGRLLVIGGNQSDRVSVAPFDMARVAGYRMPPGHAPDYNLPLLASTLSSSINEA